MRIIIKKFAIQDENHNQEIQEYGHLPLLQFIQDDNQTFHPLKAIQDDNQTFHPLQAIQDEFPKKRPGYPHLSLTQPVVVVDNLRTYLS